jgi:2-dehydropantoate 2-reductase
MKVAIVGAGGVGGWLAARLLASGTDVRVLARGQHLEAIRSAGLRLRSPSGDLVARVPATPDASSIGPCDVVLFCVKTYDSDRAGDLLPTLCGDSTVVASVQNGVDNAERLARIVGGTVWSEGWP